MGQRVSNGHQQPVGVEWLFQEIESSQLCCFDCCCNRPVPRDHHHLCIGVELSNSTQGIQPIQASHLHVQKHEMGSEVRVQRDRFAAGRRHPDYELLVLEHLLQCLPNAWFVVHDEDPVFHARGTPISVALPG